MNFKENSNFGWREKSGGRNTWDALGGRNTENLIKFACFYIKNSQFHVFFSNFSRVCMFCDDDCSKLVPESTESGGFLSWMIVNKLNKKPKIEHLIIEKNVHTITCLWCHRLRHITYLPYLPSYSFVSNGILIYCHLHFPVYLILLPPFSQKSAADVLLILHLWCSPNTSLLS